MTDRLARSALPELAIFRATLLGGATRCWPTSEPAPDAMTEGFNGKAKRRAYGYRSFRNYRLRLLNACA